MENRKPHILLIMNAEDSYIFSFRQNASSPYVFTYYTGTLSGHDVLSFLRGRDDIEAVALTNSPVQESLRKYVEKSYKGKKILVHKHYPHPVSQPPYDLHVAFNIKPSDFDKLVEGLCEQQMIKQGS